MFGGAVDTEVGGAWMCADAALSEDGRRSPRCLDICLLECSRGATPGLDAVAVVSIGACCEPMLLSKARKCSVMDLIVLYAGVSACCFLALSRYVLITPLCLSIRPCNLSDSILSLEFSFWHVSKSDSSDSVAA